MEIVSGLANLPNDGIHAQGSNKQHMKGLTFEAHPQNDAAFLSMIEKAQRAAQNHRRRKLT